jgi:hypothetical protein
MLNRNFAIALAVAMVLAVLYGCSSSGGIKNDRDMYKANAEMYKANAEMYKAEAEMLKGQLATAEMDRDGNAGEVTRLTGELATAVMERDTNAGEVTRLEGMQTVYTPTEHEMAVVAGLTGTTAGPIGENDTVTVEIDGSDSTMSTFAHDQAAEAAFMAGDETAPDAGEVWVGSMFARMSAADADPMTEDKVFVYSDRTGPVAQGYQEFYATAENDDFVSATNPVDGTDDPRVELTFEDDVAAAEAGRFASAWFPAQPSQTFTLTNVDDPATTDMMENAVAGSYRGITGMYSCDGSAMCTATTDMDGKLITFSLGWMFTPAAVAEGGTPHMIEGVVDDDTYAYFGYWLHVTNPGTDDEAIGISAFAGGGTPAVPTSAMEEIVGTASYSGKAGGKYAVKTLTSNGLINSLQVGQFVADVALDATFRGTAVAEDDRDKISGTVSKFMDPAIMDGGYIGGGDDGWMVTLDEAMTNDAAGGTTNGGMMGGSWMHAFHDRGTDDATTDDVDEEDLPPGYVTGTFDAHFNNGHLLGAFGAAKAE